MASSLCELHIWTTKNQTIIADGDLGCHTFHEKGETVSSVEQPFYEEKQLYTESRDVTWMPKNRRPEKFRDTLKEVEDLLAANRCVQTRWKSRRLLQIFLSNGALISFVVSGHSGDLERVFIDRTFVGKLVSDCATDALLTDNFIAVSYQEKTKLDYIYFTKKIPPADAIKKFEKMSVYDPRLSQLDLPGPTGRRLERHLSCNIQQDLVLAWWPTASEEAWPWAPMTSDRDRANLIILGAYGPRLDVLCYARTECDPLHAAFSLHQPYQVFTVEQASSAGGDFSIDTCVYETNRSAIKRTAVTTIPMKNSVVAHCRSPNEQKVLLCCDDGSLIMYDDYKRVTQVGKAAFIPSHASWHPSGMVLIIAGSRGELQVFDLALAPLKIQLVQEMPKPMAILEIGHYFRSPSPLAKAIWCPYEFNSTDCMSDPVDSFLLLFDRGPLCLLQYSLGVCGSGHLSAGQLVSMYIKHRQVDLAVNVLSGLDWNTDGGTCFACLATVMDHLLRQTLNPQREVLLEMALGSFYSPTRPLSEAVVLEFRDPISRFARRFFHHLLRFSRFEKAFLLAVDIGARDLFMDIHYLAKDRGETALAEVAKQKAEQLEAESIGTDSVDEFDEEDEFSDEESYEGSDDCDVDRPPLRGQNANGLVSPGSAHPGQRGFQPANWESVPGSDGSVTASVVDIEATLSSELMQDYTNALLETDFSDQIGGDEEQEDADENSSTVKVIHFGVV